MSYVFRRYLVGLKPLLLFLVTLMLVHHQALAVNLVESAPIGSWQVRETIDVSPKGKQTGSTVKTSMIGKEERDGELHYWIEMYATSFKVKKNGKRKKTGKPVVMKSLIPASVLTDDPENVFNNLRAFGVETIVQSGNEDPMRITKGNGFLASVMSGTNMEIKYNFEELGNESVEVSAGKFSAKKMKGEGNASMKVALRKYTIESTSTVWLSDDVPFGIVKLEGVTTTNGKTSSQTAELLEYSTSGAVSAITKTPRDMPSIPNIFGG